MFRTLIRLATVVFACLILAQCRPADSAKKPDAEIIRFFRQMVSIDKRLRKPILARTTVLGPLADDKPVNRAKVKTVFAEYERLHEQALLEVKSLKVPTSSKSARAYRDAFARYLAVVTPWIKAVDAKVLPLIPPNGHVSQSAKKRIQEAHELPLKEEDTDWAAIRARDAFCEEYGLEFPLGW